MASGLADVDAITLSMAQLSAEEGVLAPGLVLTVGTAIGVVFLV